MDRSGRTARRRRWPWLIGALAVVAALAATGLWLTLRDNARPVATDEARERLPGDTAGTEPGDSTRLPRPARGVYEYEGSGEESLSTPPLSQSQGPTMPGTVEHLDDGCWSFRIDLSTNHWQEWTFCPEGDDLVEAGGRTWQRWMIGATALTNLSSFECDPGAVVLPGRTTPGQEWTARCTGTNEAAEGTTVSSGPYRFVGEDELEVGDERIRTLRFDKERSMSGAQTGTDRASVWLEATTGLPVRNERRVEVTSTTPIGDTTYTETGSFQLLSTRPT